MKKAAKMPHTTLEKVLTECCYIQPVRGSLPLAGRILRRHQAGACGGVRRHTAKNDIVFETKL